MQNKPALSLPAYIPPPPQTDQVIYQNEPPAVPIYEPAVPLGQAGDQYVALPAVRLEEKPVDENDCPKCGSSKSMVQKLKKTCVQYLVCILLVFSLPFLLWIPFSVRRCYRVEKVCAICEMRKVQARR